MDKEPKLINPLEIVEESKETLKNKFNDYVKSKNMRRTEQRDFILNTFLNTEDHVSAQDLFDMVRIDHPDIGYATISRTLNLMVESGISWIVDFNDGVRRFDHKYGCMTHDHIICTECHQCIEFFDHEIEELKQSVAKRFGFKLHHSKLDLFVSCPETAKNCPKKALRRIEN